MNIRSAIRLIAALLIPHRDPETAIINVNKPYKPRRLKLDPAHRLARKAYKVKTRNPNFRRQRTVYRKKYLRRNGRMLHKRSEFVSRIRRQRGLN